ncbi:MAG: bifunctional folylpolyglutamate synthase/dihydrofolate synthase [Bacteroidetes bacterium]|jgi:dihydrofolate synthase / folylpolyglutamate synthase|nr:bifunctional folylpolyglutamate synthase/dihydrofolate synthase [Bacteroidota bacterium]MBT4398347.1 bifunctional folylpolyglutamate synthase/dihydrofolate synthase [Bacteroidota bacterium]MBT4408963.1 bifunctional folylpolyglutamate synthase/dihydrofolate synthase [Bacteroidota bacterium]MBT5428201.1 bifunctional folylpolyglutamate synthase/dihydrofolate synthase [Bacteroidota bacterium]MBT7094097.1 bifunctional folylpolyglutamate synthase/dihydrofolate synthase [Bacteroidota bacterium]
MTKYDKILEWLYSQLPMYQRMGKAAYKADLDNTLKLDEYFGHPHEQFRSIHVAGTNGKGSVAHLLASVLQSAGYKTGLYTSPHLIDFRERIRINGAMMPKKELISWVERHKNFFEALQPSFFEMTVALAFDYFASQEVEIAVVEVGMGGRLDSTNILIPEVSVITGIAKDHTEFLGNTLVSIAKEKAGIIKDGIPVVIGEKRPEIIDVFEEFAGRLKAPLYLANQYFQVPYSVLANDGKQYFNVRRGKRTVFPELYSDLEGIVQRKNLPVVLETLEVMKHNKWTIPDEAVYAGIANAKKLTGLKGRWDIVEHKPNLVFDTAHNEEGIKNLLKQLDETKYNKLHLVLGMVSDKNIDKVLQLLPRAACYYFTQAGIPRALDSKILAAKAGYYGLNGSIVSSVPLALEKAKEEAEEDDLILVTGSTYIVADAVGE